MGNILSCLGGPRDSVQINKPEPDLPASGDNSNREGASTSAPAPTPTPTSAAEEEATTMDESGEQTSFLGTETETSDLEQRGRRKRRVQSGMAPRSKNIKKRKKKSKVQTPKKN